MVINGFIQVFLCGVFGGSLGELLKWYRLRERKGLPLYAKSVLYWIITLLVILFSGVFAIFYSTEQASALMAVFAGLGCPCIIKSVASPFEKEAGRSTSKSKATTQAKFRVLKRWTHEQLHNMELLNNGRKEWLILSFLAS